MLEGPRPFRYDSSSLVQAVRNLSFAEMESLRARLSNRGREDLLVSPRLGIITPLESEDVGTRSYIKALERKAPDFGVEIVLINYNPTSDIIDMLGEIKGTLNSIDGGVVTLPLPDHLEPLRAKIIEEFLPFEKDVDGLRQRSRYQSPTPTAMFEIIKDIRERQGISDEQKALIGLGQVGQKLKELLMQLGGDLSPMDQKEVNDEIVAACKLVVCTARGTDVITKEHISPDLGVVLINAGRSEVNEDAIRRSLIYVSGSQIGDLAIAHIMANTIHAYTCTK